MSLIYVTNEGSQKAVGEYCNKLYEFPCGVSVAVPIEVAKHIFGFGDEDKYQYLVRLGWMKITTERERAMDRLAQIKFSREPIVKGQLLAPLVERVAPPPNAHKARQWAKVQPVA